jgi:acetyltransferase-like isoleucine patch superfamily enzyme
MWTNQYVKESFYAKDSATRQDIGAKHLVKGLERDLWQKDFVANRRFLNKYSNKRFSLPTLSPKRIKAYQKRYHMGDGCFIEHDVELSRQHYLPGTIKIGRNVVLAKHTFIDYSGNVVIEDNVKMAAGVVIESHHRDLEAFQNGLDVNIPTNLLIRESAYIGLRAIILDSCSYIGINSRIGAGAVVTKDIPDNATAVGIPAKVIKINE